GRHDWATREALRRLRQRGIAVAPQVDDVDGLRLGVAEDEEVVSDELELEHGFLRRHRRNRELLRLDDRRLVLLDLDRRLLGCDTAVAGVPARGDAPLLPVAPDLTPERVHELVARR